MTAEEQRQYSQWDVIAEEEGFVVVFPEGVPDSPSQLRKESFSDNKILLLVLTKTTRKTNITTTQQTSLLLMKVEFSFRSWNINDDTGVYGDVCDRDR